MKQSSSNLGALVYEQTLLPKAFNSRPQPKLIFCDPEGQDDEPVGFTVKPSEDIPKNKLTIKKEICND